MIIFMIVKNSIVKFFRELPGFLQDEKYNRDYYRMRHDLYNETLKHRVEFWIWYMSGFVCWKIY